MFFAHLRQSRSHLRWLAFSVAAAGAFIAPRPVAAQIMYPPPPAYRYARADASVRVEVAPKQAEVYVDGYYAGIVDDFDGTFQRLHTTPGEHEITIYLDGYHALHQNVYLMPDKTFSIKARLERLEAGETAEPRPTPTVSTNQPPPGTAPFPYPRGRGRGLPPQPLPPGPPPAGPETAEPPNANATGTLSIDLQPSDAEVLIDGQPIPTSQGQGPVLIDLSEGRHVLQVRKNGFVGYLTEVEIRRGATSTMTVTLRRP